MNLIEFFIENWAVIIAAIAVLSIAIFAVYSFINYPNNTKIQKVREWLLYAVMEAEREFGSNTGKIKLRYVYDLFISKFPPLSRAISFDSFSLLVDEALLEFKKLLSQNKTLQVKVYNKELTPEEVKKIEEQIEGGEV